MIIKNAIGNVILKLITYLFCFIISILLLVIATMLYRNFIQTEGRIQTSPKTGFYVNAYDTQLFIQKVGNEGSPIVIFVHGTGAWSEMWRPYMNQVAAMGYQAIALDVPPFGYSLPPKSGNFNKVEQAKRILGALDSLGVKRATFVAHSIGASPLMEALLSQPKRVSGLILISPALGLESTLTNGSDSTLQKLLRKKIISEPIAACIFTNGFLTSTLVKSFVSEKDKVSDKWVGLYKRPFALSGSYQNIALWIPELVAGRSSLISDNPESYQAINYPVTLIWGVSDTITPISQGKYLKTLIPGASLTELPGGHVPMIEEPEQLGKLLSKMLADHS